MRGGHNIAVDNIVKKKYLTPIPIYSKMQKSEPVQGVRQRFCYGENCRTGITV